MLFRFEEGLFEPSGSKLDEGNKNECWVEYLAFRNDSSPFDRGWTGIFVFVAERESCGSSSESRLTTPYLLLESLYTTHIIISCSLYAPLRSAAIRSMVSCLISNGAIEDLEIPNSGPLKPENPFLGSPLQVHNQKDNSTIMVRDPI